MIFFPFLSLLSTLPSPFSLLTGFLPPNPYPATLMLWSLSPPQRLLLVNISKEKREREHGGEKTGTRATFFPLSSLRAFFPKRTVKAVEGLCGGESYCHACVFGCVALRRDQFSHAFILYLFPPLYMIFSEALSGAWHLGNIS